MKVRIARIAKRMHNKFRGLYWRQMFVTVGMVLLTLFLLGVSFFSLSYNYARGQENGELAAQAQVVGQLSASYLENGRYLDMEELQHEEDFQRLASFAATVSEVDFLICDVEGHVLLSTDASLSGLVVTMPEEMTAEVLEEGISSRRTDVDGLYSNKRFVVGVPAISEDTPDPVGMVYAVSSTTSLDTLQEENDLPIVGVVEPTCRRALLVTQNKKVGIIATLASIRSGAYEAMLRRLDPAVEIIGKPCPLFVPLVENGRISNEL